MPRKLPTKVVVHPDNPIAQAQHALEMAHLYSTPDPGAKGPIDWEKYEDSREDPRENSQLLLLLLRDDLLQKEISALMASREYPNAVTKLKEGIAYVVGDDHEVPLNSKDGGGVQSDKYMRLGIREQMILARYCNLVGQCMAKMGRDEEALNWFTEVEMIFKNSVFAKKHPVFDWIDVNYNQEDYLEQRFIAFKEAAEIFWKLGNTAAVSHRLYKIDWLLRVLPHQLRYIYDSLAPRYGDLPRYRETRALRHPDPKLCGTLDIKNPDLQLRGSWQKITLPNRTVLQARFHFASFVWNRHFYVCGGEKDWTGPFYRDFWCLDLEKLDEWRKLPECPYPDGDPKLGIVSGWQMRVHGGRAYMFAGKKEVPYFDLETERWGSIMTAWNERAAYPRTMRMFHDYAMEIVDGKMYVLGGAHADCTLGCNLFMVLDIERRTWRKLSGLPGPNHIADPLVPGPRRLTVSWVGREKDKVFFLFGEAERVGAKMSGEEHGSTNPYAYDDLWSWNIKREAWRRERYSGNIPCQRSEPAVLYHEQLDKVILFGGSNSTLPTFNNDMQSAFQYTYFADTFVLDQSPLASPHTGPRWKQVLTRGFPTYRSQAALFTDPATGRVFLFGGYTAVKFIPPRADPLAEDSRAFGDLWELKLDLPGGHFEGVDLEEEARTARLGPWQRCYNCGSAGPWKKCGGTCHGQVFFCDNQCLKEGWKEHKKKHGCTKK